MRLGSTKNDQQVHQAWFKCEKCGNIIYYREFKEVLDICQSCSYHYPLTPQRWIDCIFDEDSFEELDRQIASVDILGFAEQINYSNKLRELRSKFEQNDAIITGTVELDSQTAYVGITDSRFLMGSMGSVVGEKISRIFEYAHDAGCPVITITTSGGGARMHEGAISLMQMVKTSQAVRKYRSNGGLYISILANPTMAGVMASFAALGDIIIAEPKALIGFTGPRVIEQTIKQSLPPGFQTSEFMLQHGFVDMIVERKGMRSMLTKLVDYLWL
ncbi:MAG: acetyl-CoA carboxylase, carboxyltransferase subunit beta [Planctomycetes bacterium]|nr:acetyl-CoA carboxylase, carboxyltransferase subunit beta [Planctomycetota bacterium]